MIRAGVYAFLGSFALVLSYAGCSSGDDDGTGSGGSGGAAGAGGTEATCTAEREGKSFCDHRGGGYSCENGTPQFFFDGPCDAFSAACNYIGCKSNCTFAQCKAVDAGCESDAAHD